MKKLIALVALLQRLAPAGMAADKPTFNVADFGAKGDGVTKETAAIQKTLDACGKEGGGMVLVPPGAYLTGSLVLHANTTLQLASRANLLGSPDISDYPLETVCWEGESSTGHWALLCASNAANITFTGGAIFGPQDATLYGRQGCLPPHRCHGTTTRSFFCSTEKVAGR